MGLSKGSILWSGGVLFPAGTGADGLMQVLDVPELPVTDADQLMLSIRNTSKDENLTVDVGTVMTVKQYVRTEQKRLECSTDDTADTFTTIEPHKLHIGDRIAFEGTGGGVTADIYYYVVAIASAFVFQVSATYGGAVFNVNAATTNAFDFVPSPDGNVNVASSSIAGDTFTCATKHGLTVGDCIIFSVANDAALANVKYYVIATSTAYTFQISASRGGTTLDVLADAGTGVFALCPEFFSLTTIQVPKFAASSYLVNVAGCVSKIVQGWPFGNTGGRLCFSPGDQTYDAFSVFASIRRV